MTKEELKEYMKAYYQAHKDYYKAYILNKERPYRHSPIGSS